MWLRRLIDEQLSAAYGPNYFDSKDESGNNRIKNKIREDLASRRSNDPARYPRPIDAALLDDVINIVCNPQLYKEHFAEALQRAFPVGHQHARAVLKCLLEPRNALAHANPVSVRQCEQVVCYSNDVIDSLKAYYAQKSIASEYNVPTILVVKDSFGNILHAPNMRYNGLYKQASFNKEPKLFLRPGDTLSLEIEVDPSFSSSEYTLKWRWGTTNITPLADRTRLVLPIEPKHVQETLAIFCEIITARDWHRYGMFDDGILLTYRVLPPLK